MQEKPHPAKAVAETQTQNTRAAVQHKYTQTPPLPHGVGLRLLLLRQTQRGTVERTLESNWLYRACYGLSRHGRCCVLRAKLTQGHDAKTTASTHLQHLWCLLYVCTG
jgi:hypothetical protein